MLAVTVSTKGRVIIPAEIRHRLGITPGCQLDFRLDGHAIHAEVKRQLVQTHAEDGFGMLVCKLPGKRRLADFDVASAMQKAKDDRP